MMTPSVTAHKVLDRAAGRCERMEDGARCEEVVGGIAKTYKGRVWLVVKKICTGSDNDENCHQALCWKHVLEFETRQVKRAPRKPPAPDPDQKELPLDNIGI